MKEVCGLKRLLLSLLALCMFLSSCIGNEKTAEPAKETVVKESSPTIKNTDGTTDSNESGFTVLDLKKKYKTETNNAVMPLYNVKRDEVFKFSFNANINHLTALDVISVHTDIETLPNSQIDSIIDFGLDPSVKNVIEVMPLVGVLVSSETYGGYDGYWGNAPVYYIRINYDMKASTPTKLDNPIIIPFTLKSDVPVPNLGYEIDAEGRLKLVWDAIEGVDGYKIYNSSRIEQSGRGYSVPVPGPEEGYEGEYLAMIHTLTDTEYDDDTFGTGIDFGPFDILSTQNYIANGDYYVTAIKDGKESNFSSGVSTYALGNKLPFELEESILEKEYDSLSSLPRKARVEFVNGSVHSRDVVYEIASIDLGEYRDPAVYYRIKGTAIKGYVNVLNASREDVETLKASQANESSAGYVEPANTTKYVPAPDLPTIIEEEEEESTDKGGASNFLGDLVGTQQDNTDKLVEKGNREIVPTPEVLEEINLNADSALEEYLARSMIDGREKISLRAFPEAQNSEVLFDTMDKVMYQNPLILGVDQYEYNYFTLNLAVSYDDSANVIKRKQQEIVTEAMRVVAATINESMSDEEKRKALYDYLDKNTRYDQDALDSAEANNYEDVDDTYNDSFTTYGIMVNKMGVCMSYAYTYKLLGDLAGIETIVVTGTLDSVPHAWNKIKLDNEWLNVDPTNGETNTGVPYLLYNSNDATAEDLNFELDDLYWLDNKLVEFEGQSNSNDYYVVNDLEVNSISDYQAKLAQLLDQGQSTLSVRMVPKVDEDKLMNAISEVLEAEVTEDEMENAVMYELGNYVVIKL